MAIKRPTKVRIALWLLWVPVIGSVILTSFLAWNVTPLLGSARGAVLVALVVVFGLLAFLNVSVARGRKWAAAIIAWIAVAGLLGDLYEAATVDASTLQFGAAFVKNTLWLTCAALLYSRDGRAWFEAMKEERSSTRLLA